MAGDPSVARRALRGTGLALALFLLSARSALAEPPQSEADFCLSCHGDDSLDLTLDSGETLSLFVDPDVLARSVHGGKLRCADCHTDIESYPHPERSLKSLREFVLAYYEGCKGCHFDNYTKTLDSVHYTMLSKGDSRAPLCVDCHGAHDVARPGIPKARISRTCSNCHEEVYRRYSQSVHGTALLQEQNADVPVCTNCHRSHDIEDARTASFRLRTPELCAGCHADEKLMQKYSLSTQVLQTYLRDFHGMTTSFYRKEKSAPSTLTAVCIDCHGVHDILSVKGPSSGVLKANLAKVCTRCHPGATANFPAAWISHYEPTPQKSPLVYYVKLFYRYFIPFVLFGLVLQILLHVWRVVVNR